MNPQEIKIESYDYPLPDEMIAKHPLKERDACKLLIVSDKGDIGETIFSELPALLAPDSVLVYNNTRVINARLRLRKSTGAVIEIFCLEPESPADYAVNFATTDSCEWTCLVGNSKRWKSGPLVCDVDVKGSPSVLTAERVSTDDSGSRIRFSWTGGFSFAEVIEAVGEIPIPPYLNRESEPDDATDYQTVYSHIDGSVAAPTAGLHFTDKVLGDIDKRGIKRLEVTLHVGAGTFRPVKSDSIGEHDMHSEFINVSRATIESLRQAEGSVIAVGTTSVRTLESLYQIGCLIKCGQWDGEVPQWYPYSSGHPGLSRKEALAELLGYMDSHGMTSLTASTRIIIAPGYEYKMVDGMVTNFHQPRSTLLLLVSAFLGEDRWRPAYDYALSHNFRFLSYGDACLLKKG